MTRPSLQQQYNINQVVANMAIEEMLLDDNDYDNDYDNLKQLATGKRTAE